MNKEAFKIIEITGTSSEGQDQAIASAIEKASATLKDLCWYEVVESRGAISDGQIAQYQVTVKIGFRLEAG